MGQNTVSEIAGIIADKSRASILVALMDGRMHPASELAYIAGVKPQTASFHLTKMFNLNLVMVEKQGRHRYYSLNPDVASILENLLVIAPPIEVKSFKQATQVKAIKHARTCYDHFAGEFGVALTDSLLSSGYIKEDEKEYVLTKKGNQFFIQFGIDLEDLKKRKRQFSRKCLDWSERKYHLAGSLGQSLVFRFHELNWTQPLKDTRAVKVTEIGKRGIKEQFNLDFN